MKKLNLDIGKAGNLKNLFNHRIKVSRLERGYFISINEEKSGPFDNIFLDKSENGIEVLIGYKNGVGKLFKINATGITHAEVSVSSLDKLKELSKNIDNTIANFNKTRFEGCTHLGDINHYSIYIDSDLRYFVVDNSQQLQNIESYPKFDDYSELVSYYKSKNIILNNSRISTLAMKAKRTFINFEEFYEFIMGLQPKDLTENIMEDIISERSILKNVFNMYKNKLAKFPKTVQEAEELLAKGYIELEYRTIEKLKELFPNEFEKLSSSVSKSSTTLRPLCIEEIKNRDKLNFEELLSCFSSLRITDLPDTARREISAKRPLTTSIISGMLASSVDKLKEKGFNVRESYKFPKIFKAIYPDEYEVLCQKALEMMPELYEEFYQVQKEKFRKVIK